MLYEGKEQGLWEWAEVVIAKDKGINIAQDAEIVPLELSSMSNHPISEKQGE